MFCKKGKEGKNWITGEEEEGQEVPSSFSTLTLLSLYFLSFLNFHEQQPIASCLLLYLQAVTQVPYPEGYPRFGAAPT